MVSELSEVAAAIVGLLIKDREYILSPSFSSGSPAAADALLLQSSFKRTLLMEKMVEASFDKFVIIIDDMKLVISLVTDSFVFNLVFLVSYNDESKPLKISSSFEYWTMRTNREEFFFCDVDLEDNKGF
ncbi:hypothetical protein LINPERPRIM_LOCUS21551 [Linum perenne]